MRLRKLAPAGNRPLEACKRLLTPAGSMQRQATIKPVLNAIGRQRQSAIVAVDCFELAAEIAEDVCEMTVRRSKTRRDCNRALEAVDRLVMLPKCAQGAPEQGVSIGVTRIAGQCFACKRGAFVEAAGLARHQSEIVIRIGI